MTDQEIIDLINGIIDMWEEDTCVQSYIDYDHPAFSIIEKLANNYQSLTITTILKYIEKKPSWCFGILSKIVPQLEQPSIPLGHAGRIHKLIGVWVEWGKRKGYID